MLPPEDIFHLKMSVGEGMKMLISGGAVIPPYQAKQLKKRRSKSDPKPRRKPQAKRAARQPANQNKRKSQTKE